MNPAKASTLPLAVAILTLASAAYAQQSKAPAPAPVPGQIATAKKVFVSNAGGDNLVYPTEVTILSGGPDRPYNEFYEALTNWGHYDIVSSPSDADLVFEISWVYWETGPRVRLLVIDPKTRITLWSLSEYFRAAALQGNRDKNFDQSMSIIVSRLKEIAMPPSPSARH